jgi:hypothetical protein
MTKYLITKASKFTRRNARRVKLASRVDWTRKDDDAAAVKPTSGAGRRVACIALAVAFLPVLAYYGAAPTCARGSGGWSRSSTERSAPTYTKADTARKENTR